MPRFKVGDVVYLTCAGEVRERTVVEVDPQRGTDIYRLGYWADGAWGGNPGVRTYYDHGWTEERFILTKEQAVSWRLAGGGSLPYGGGAPVDEDEEVYRWDQSYRSRSNNGPKEVAEMEGAQAAFGCIVFVLVALLALILWCFSAGPFS